MIKTKLVIVLLILITMSGLSCKQPAISIPTKLFPAYNIEVQYPNRPGRVTVKQGDSFAVTVTIRSLVDMPIVIRPILIDAGGQSPGYLTYEPQKDYTTLAPNNSFSENFTIRVAGNAPVGTQSIGFRGELQEPVPDRAGAGFSFILEITAQ
jgi:hypothetical protein